MRVCNLSIVFLSFGDISFVKVDADEGGLEVITW